MAAGFVNTLFLTLLLAFGLASAQASSLLPSEPQPVAEPAYGEILYQYFQDRDFAALTAILRAQAQGRLKQHDAEAKVLQGRLYLRYGLQNKAEQLLRGLISQPIQSRTRAELYFLLAESRHQIGDNKGARSFLTRIDDGQIQRFHNEYHHLSASLAFEAGDFSRANQHLDAIRDDASLAAYARYNHGVALLRVGENEAAINRFNAVLQVPARSLIERNLVDKTALTLGYYHLQNSAPGKARRYLLSVREDSQFASRALLGLGWSYLNEANYREAIAPWRKLSEGDKRDLAVQEGLLALPFAYQSLQANQQSMESYQAASGLFEAEKSKLQRIIEQVRKGELLPLFRHHTRQQQGVEFQSNWQPSKLNLEASEHNYYLIELLASKSFYFAFRDYQDLYYLRTNIEHWSQQIPIYSRMIRENRAFYRQKIPAVERKLRTINPKRYSSKLARLKQMRQKSDSPEGNEILATDTEQGQLKTIRALKKSLGRMKGKIELTEQEEKLKFLDGVMQWQLDAKKIDRQWQATKIIWAVEEQREKLDKQMARSARSSEIAGKRFSGFDQRLAQLRSRLQQANRRIDGLLRRYEARLNAMAVAALKERADMVHQLELQSDLALARLLDSTYSAGAQP